MSLRMIRSAVTVSLVAEARGGPFVFWDDLAGACEQAAALGFDAVELFAPGPDAVDPTELEALLKTHGLGLAAVGTGAGMVKHGLSLTSADADERQQAIAFVRQMIDFGGNLGAPAIIGSMQGKWGGNVARDQAMAWLRDALSELGQYASKYATPLVYEPLNRYETNLVCTIGDGVELIKSLATDNVRLLADLFHMQIEEVDLAAAIQTGARYIGHVHFVDSNRRPAGCGHTDFQPIADALAAINFAGYASAEAFPYPSPQGAAVQTIETFKKYFR